MATEMISAQAATIGVKQFRIPSLARSETLLSYCVWDRQSRQAAWIDPHFSAFQEYTDFVSAEGLKPVATIDSQLHYSHPTAAHLLSKRFGITLYPNGKLTLGASVFEILKTPGVRPEAVCIRGPGVIFTGETLWAGATAGFGMPDANIRELWSSLQTLKKILKSEEIVFPGYDVLDLCFSTWRCELEKNPDLLARDPDELARMKMKFPFHPADDFQAFAKFNAQPDAGGETRFQKCESPFRMDDLERESPSYATITAEKLAHKKGFVIDIREPEEFSRGHIPGARSLPLSEIPFALAELRANPRVYVACQAGRRSALVAATLSYLGMRDVVMLSGGFQAWQNAGLPVEK